MKKVSTAAAKQSRNFSQQKLTIGLDLGDRSSWYCVLDEAGNLVLEQRLSTTAKALREVFGGMPRSRIALETGTHSPWISRLLSELGHEVIVAHARKVRLIELRGALRGTLLKSQRNSASDALSIFSIVEKMSVKHIVWHLPFAKRSQCTCTAVMRNKDTACEIFGADRTTLGCKSHY